jgi:hypothetical protein
MPSDRRERRLSASTARSRRPDAEVARDHGLLEGDRTAGGSGRQWLRGGYFPPALATPRDESRGDPDCGPLHREAK